MEWQTWRNSVKWVEIIATETSHYNNQQTKITARNYTHYCQWNSQTHTHHTHTHTSTPTITTHTHTDTQDNKSTHADNVALPAAAAIGWRLLPAGHTAANLQRRVCCAGTDRQTVDLHTWWAVATPENQSTQSKSLLWQHSVNYRKRRSTNQNSIIYIINFTHNIPTL